MAIDDITLSVEAICTMALSHIGMKGFTDYDAEVAANNPSALAIGKHWASCRNEVLGDSKFPFSTVIGTLDYMTLVDSDDYPEWESFWTYPSSVLKVWNVFDESTVKTKDESQFEIVYNPTLDEKVICCNLDTNNTAYAEESYSITDPLSWDTRFVMAFSYRLAAAICKELTGSDEMSIKMLQIYGNYISETKRQASIEKKSKPTQSNPTVEARG